MTDDRQAPLVVRIPEGLQELFLAKIKAENMTKQEGMIASIQLWLGMKKTDFPDSFIHKVMLLVEQTERMNQELAPLLAMAGESTDDYSQELEGFTINFPPLSSQKPIKVTSHQ